MAADEFGIRLTIHLVNAAIMLLIAAVLWTLPHRAARVLAVGNAAVGTVHLIFAPVILGPQEGAAWAGWDATVWFTVWVGGLALLGAMWLYPEPPRSRIERVVFGATAAVHLVLAYTLIFAPGWTQPPPGVPTNLTVQWAFLSPWSVVRTLLGPITWLFWFRRVRSYQGPERPAALFYAASATYPMLIAIVYYSTVAAIAFVRQDRVAWVPEFTYVSPGIHGDPFHLAATMWLAAMTLIVVIVVYTAKKRVYLPLALLGLAVVVEAGSRLASIDFRQFWSVFNAFILMWGITHYGLFGARTLPRWAGLALAGAFGLAMMLLTVTIIVSAAPDNPILLALGIAIGLALAIAIGWLVVRKMSGMPALLQDASTTRSRIEPYHAVLQQELAAGTPRERAFEKLKPLRVRLGVSDHEHAILEYASGPEQATRLTGRAVKPGETFLSRYRIERTLREGGMGVTHLAFDTRLGRPVVLKTLRSARGAGSLDDLLKEARAMSRVDHPNVVRLLDSDAIGDEAFLVMEYVDGGSLQERLEKGKLTPEEFAPLARDLFAALDAVHEADLVHRDIKPGNVLLTRRGAAKLGDFGVAHLPGFETTAGAHSAGAVGTIRYMSPEQARGRPATPKSDMFCLASVLYEAWTGKRYREVREQESAMELQLRVAASGPFEKNGLPPSLHAWFARALDPTPASRFGSVREMEAALAVALEASEATS